MEEDGRKYAQIAAKSKGPGPGRYLVRLVPTFRNQYDFSFHPPAARQATILAKRKPLHTLLESILDHLLLTK
jgi:hypothetical protein